MSEELYKRLRPKTLDQVLGQPTAVSALKGFLSTKSVPHAILFHGPSGCGKTTLARIMAAELGAKGLDLIERNFASSRGIEEVREIETQMTLAPMSGKCKVYILDEAHAMTSQAAQSMLKMLEDTPKHVYFMLCTSEPEKLAKALKTRLTAIGVTGLRNEYVLTLLKTSVPETPDKVAESITKAAQGSARMALVLLEQAEKAAWDPEVVKTITQVQGVSEETINMVRAIVSGDLKSWSVVYGVVNEAKDEELESLRHFVLAYTKTCFKTTANGRRLSAVVDAFGQPFFNSKKAGFLASCYRAMTS